MARPRRRVTTAPVPGADPTPQLVPGRDGQPDRRIGEPAGEDRPDAWGDRAVEYDDGLVVRSDSANGSNDAALRENVPPHNV